MNSNERLLFLIKLRLKSALKNAEILPHGEAIYIVNSDNLEWYFILNNEGLLRFNYKFFDTMFLLFSMEQNRYTKILKQIIEKCLEAPVRSIQRVGSDLNWEINVVVSNKRKEWGITKRYGFPYYVVKKYLDYKKFTNNEKMYFIEFV